MKFFKFDPVAKKKKTIFFCAVHYKSKVFSMGSNVVINQYNIVDYDTFSELAIKNCIRRKIQILTHLVYIKCQNIVLFFCQILPIDQQKWTD